MNPSGIASTNAELNEKYGKFWVMRYSSAQARFIGIGKPHGTIEKAIKACHRCEIRNPEKYYSVDVRP